MMTSGLSHLPMPMPPLMDITSAVESTHFASHGDVMKLDHMLSSAANLSHLRPIVVAPVGWPAEVPSADWPSDHVAVGVEVAL